jgi:tetratricopeptide (TPR) repeat protein
MAVMVAVILAAMLIQQPETLSLLGEPLYPFSLSKAARAKADEDLRTAHAAYAKTPNDVAAIIALEQAHLAFGRVGDSIEILTHGLEANPDDPRLLLERGRDYIRIRKFEVAQRDLEKAAAALPNASCALGFARYLAGAYARAQASYAACREPGLFGYLSARRAGQASAPRPAESAPVAAAYLDAVERLLEGNADEATKRLKEIVGKHRSDWMEPAYIAAEADYAKLYKPPRRKKKRLDAISARR